MKSVYKLKLITLLISVLTVFALLSSSCSSSTTEPEEEHADAEGLTLTLNGSEVVRVDEGAVTGSITVAAGAETALITLRFLDHDKDEFVPDEPEFSLGHSFADDTIAELEQHAEDGAYNFHVVGLTAGTTTLTLELIHGDHPDYQSPPITIVVN